VWETSLGQIPQQRKGALTHLWHFVLSGQRGQQKRLTTRVPRSVYQISGHVVHFLHLHALVHEGEDVAAGNQLLDGASQTLRQATEKIQRHDHEVFVGGFVLVWL